MSEQEESQEELQRRTEPELSEDGEVGQQHAATSCLGAEHHAGEEALQTAVSKQLRVISLFFFL